MATGGRRRGLRLSEADTRVRTRLPFSLLRTDAEDGGSCRRTALTSFLPTTTTPLAAVSND
jgi:hypothetical protein